MYHSLKPHQILEQTTTLDSQTHHSSGLPLAVSQKKWLKRFLELKFPSIAEENMKLLLSSALHRTD